MLCIEILVVIFSVWSKLIVYETKNRQKYLPGRKFFDIHRNDKMYNRHDINIESLKNLRKKDSQFRVL
jgi:hypothetical protein